jgi:hypothetical protein
MVGNVSIDEHYNGRPNVLLDVVGMERRSWPWRGPEDIFDQNVNHY